MGIVAFDVGVVRFADGVEGALPQVEGIGQDVGLPAKRQRFALGALLAVLEGVAQASLDALVRIDGGLHGDLVLGALLQESAGTGVETFGVFADDHKVNVLGALVFQRALHAGIELDRTQVDVLIQGKSEGEEKAFLQNAGLYFGVSDGAEKNGVEPA